MRQRLAECGHLSTHLLPALQRERAVGTSADRPAQRAPAPDVNDGHQMRLAVLAGVRQFRKVRREHVQRFRLAISTEIRLNEVDLAGGFP
jgi:hypothetical protein